MVVQKRDVELRTSDIGHRTSHFGLRTFPEARKPALKLTIDFGPELGVKRSSAQLTTHYTPEELVGRQVIAAVNLGTRRIATFDSEVLVLGAMPQASEVVLLAPDQRVANGTRIG